MTFLDSKWVMKKKSNGTLRARLTARGFKQIDGEHYDSDDVSSPTINITSARVMFVLMVTMWRKGILIDVNGGGYRSLLFVGKFPSITIILHLIDRKIKKRPWRPCRYLKSLSKGTIIRLLKRFRLLKRSTFC